MTGQDSTPTGSAASLTAYLLSDLASIKRWRDRVEDRLLLLEKATYALALRQAGAGPQSWWTAWGKDFGRAAVKTLAPYLTPYLWALLTGLGALGVALFKAVTRSWLW